MPKENIVLDYDMKILTPKKEYAELYAKMKKELQDLGLDYEAW